MTDLQAAIDLLPADWAGRRITLEWTDCQKHEGCQPEWMATAETLGNEHIVASATGTTMMQALKGLEVALSRAMDNRIAAAVRDSVRAGASEEGPNRAY